MRPLVAALGSALLLSGAVGGTAPAAAGALASPAAQPADDAAALAPFYGQVLAWTTCETDTQCAWLTVPLDYADPSGETIRLRLSRIRATGPAAQRQGSLVVNPGGPGASGVEFAPIVANYIAPTVNEQFDIVGFDTRGVGRSSPITCMTGQQTTTFLRTDPAPDTPAEERRLWSVAGRIGTGCLAMSPAIARHVGSDNTAKDMDILRATLGDPQLNFLGFSYGTYLGTLYAEQFPATVGRFVLDGALDPTLDVMQVSEGQNRGFQLAMTRFAQDCAKRRSCPWRGNASTVLTGINRLLAKIDRTPLPTHTGRPLVVAEAITALFTSMYSPTSWSGLRLALRQAKVGDGLGLQSIADFASDKIGPDRYSSNMASAFPAISCWDSAPAPDFAGLRAAARQWSQDARVPDMASAMSWGNAPCSQWFGHGPRQPGPAVSSTTAPILVVGTTYDPATPYAWARALASQLTTSTLLTYRGDGHTAYGGGSGCINRAVDAYLLGGTMPAAGTVCR